MAIRPTQAYAGEQAPRREPNLENGLRLARLMFEKIRELDERVERLERERHQARPQRRR